MDATYTYSLIRVVPDRRRGEWANVGVCVFLADRLDIRLHRNTSKLRALAPSLNLSFLDELPALWERAAEALQSAEDRQAMLARMPLAHASPLAAFTASPDRYEAELASIYQDLVVPPVAVEVRNSEPRLVTTLKRHFLDSRLLGKDADDINRHLVVQHFPIDAAAGLFADFALKNGVLRFTETIDFRVSGDTVRNAKFGQAAVKAITLDKASSLHPKSIPSVVYACSDRTRELIQPSLNLLSGYAQRVYDAGNREDMADYMDMMQSAAHGAAQVTARH